MRRGIVMMAVALGTALLLYAEDPEPIKPAPRKLDRAKGRQLYDFRYASQRKKVDATSDKRDDVALAKQHLVDVGKFGDAPSLAMVLCEQAYELGMRDRTGYATAAEAAGKLLSDFPELQAENFPKAIRAYEAQYGAGTDREAAGERLIELYEESAKASAAKDDFNAAFQTFIKAYGVASSVRSSRKGEILARRRYYQTRRDLAKKPADIKLRTEAIRLCVAELDAPATAEALLDGNLDEITKTYVPVAAKDPGEVAEGACLELGNWYLELASKASQDGKRICLNRTVTYLERFLNLHKAEDTSRTQGKLLLDKAQVDLRQLEATAKRAEKPTPEKPSEWMDVLKLVDVKKHAVHGRWVRKGSALYGSGTWSKKGGRPRLMIPTAPQGNYELRVKFMKQSGTRGIWILFPAGRSVVTVALGGGGGSFHGLALLDGKGAMNNETTVRPGTLANGREYLLDIRVLVSAGKAEIAVDLDGKEIIRWAGLQSSLSVHRDYLSPNSRCPGLAVESPTRFTEVKLRKLSGEAKMVK